jgi:hypothetical protein
VKGAKRQAVVVGWREWASLPDLGVDEIKAKIDTGARTAAIHAFEIRPFVRDGQKFVRFSLHPVQHRRRPVVDCEARVLDERVVTSSSGHRQRRYVIETTLKLGNDAWPIEMALTNRDEMGFRMLLGRRALRRRFVVDPGSSFVLSRRKAAKKATPKPTERPA